MHGEKVTLSDRLAAYAETCADLATSNSVHPLLHVVRLPNEFQETKFWLPSRSNSHDLQACINANGVFAFSSPQKTPISFELLGHCIATVQDGKQSHKFGLIVHNEDRSRESRDSWKAWCQLAGQIAPVLWAHPETGVAALNHPQLATLAFVFRCVFGTNFVAKHKDCLVVNNLWGATCFALSNCKSNGSSALASSSAVTDCSNDLNGMTVDQMVRTLKSHDQTQAWSSQDFADEIKRVTGKGSKSAVVQSKAWKELQKERDAAKQEGRARYRANNR